MYRFRLACRTTDCKDDFARSSSKWKVDYLPVDSPGAEMSSVCFLAPTVAVVAAAAAAVGGSVSVVAFVVVVSI